MANVEDQEAAYLELSPKFIAAAKEVLERYDDKLTAEQSFVVCANSMVNLLLQFSKPNQTLAEYVELSNKILEATSGVLLFNMPRETSNDDTNLN